MGLFLPRQGGFARLPAAGHEVAGLLLVAECPHLPQDLGDITAQGVARDLHGLHPPLRVQNKPAPLVCFCGLVIDAVTPSDGAARVRQHGKPNAAGDHF